MRLKSAIFGAVTIWLASALFACDGSESRDGDGDVALTAEQQRALDQLEEQSQYLRELGEVCELEHVEANMYWCDDIRSKIDQLEGVEASSVRAAVTSATALCELDYPMAGVAACLDFIEPNLSSNEESELLMQSGYCEASERLFEHIQPSRRSDPEVAEMQQRLSDTCDVRLRLAQIDLYLDRSPPGCAQAEYVLGLVREDLASEGRIAERRARHGQMCQLVLGR